MVEHHTAPLGAVIPEQIPPGGLWALDVDDSIWQDIGLQEDADTAPPLWLKDEKVRAGIRNLLDFDRCVEEERRLKQERCSLQQGARRHWGVLTTAMTLAGACIVHLSILRS